MFSFNDFIDELTLPAAVVFFLFFCLTKCLRCLLNVHTELHSIYFLLLLITFILLLTVHLYNEDLNLVTFLSFCVDSINIKRNLLCKFINKSCTSLYGPLIFVYHFFFFFFITRILLLYSGDIETNPRPMILKQFLFLSLELKYHRCL